MGDPARLRDPKAIFLDIGGPIYDDENFFAAVCTALDELRAADGLGPVGEADVRAVYDEVRAAQAGSIRRELARRWLGDEGHLVLSESSNTPVLLRGPNCTCVRRTARRVSLTVACTAGCGLF